MKACESDEIINAADDNDDEDDDGDDVYTPRFLHKGTFTRRSFCTEIFLQKASYAEKPLHTDSLTRLPSRTETLHRNKTLGKPCIHRARVQRPPPTVDSFHCEDWEVFREGEVAYIANLARGEAQWATPPYTYLGVEPPCAVLVVCQINQTFPASFHSFSGLLWPHHLLSWKLLQP